MHSGFDKAWRNNGLDRRIMTKIKQLFTDGLVDLETCHLTITGISLAPRDLMEVHRTSLSLDLQPSRRLSIGDTSC